MKHILIIFDGMADIPSDFEDNRTPIMLSDTPNIKEMNKKALVGICRTAPEGMYPGSDICNMGILGYDPKIYYKGRASIEASSLGIKLNPTDVAYRTNLVSTDGKLMLDSSADHITDEEAFELISYLNEKLATDNYRFYPGVSYRHIMILHNGSMDVTLKPPYQFIGEELEKYKPMGENADLFWNLITKSYEILDSHPINIKRKAEGRLSANMIWFWAEGMLASFPTFYEKYNKKGAVVAAVDLIKGLGKMTGMDVPYIEGATGYIDTNYSNKAKTAEDMLEDHDFVMVHIEAPDEAGHAKMKDEKIKAIESIDKIILGGVIDKLKEMGEDYRILIMPDHPTPLSTGAHDKTPVPFMLYDSTENNNPNNIIFNETSAKKGIYIEDSTKLMDRLLK
ncbi:MAG: cofactor-independent phosphoglycerate mutase [Armatimonadetes bacterium]|nr:cofactor-independent phosphoglycerate mutase [Candidatus Hippobium faecium]